MPLATSTITIKAIAIRTRSSPPDRHGLRTDQTNRDEIPEHRFPQRDQGITRQHQAIVLLEQIAGLLDQELPG
jgi:hypothetical protein